MNNDAHSMSSTMQVQRVMLIRSIYLVCALAMLMLALLACGTAITQNAYYVCPTDMPQPTATVLVGTALPPPNIPSTPYIITPPQDFYVGDAVFVGQQGAPMRLRFRMQNVEVQSAGSRNLVKWQLEIRNVGTMTYEAIPPALMLISRITTANGEQVGIWHTSEAAMSAAGFTNENYDPLSPDTMRLYHLAAFIPAGNPHQFTYLLDEDSGNRITWTNQFNPHCSGDVAN